MSLIQRAPFRVLTIVLFWLTVFYGSMSMAGNVSCNYSNHCGDNGPIKGYYDTTGFEIEEEHVALAVDAVAAGKIVHNDRFSSTLRFDDVKFAGEAGSCVNKDGLLFHVVDANRALLIDVHQNMGNHSESHHPSDAKSRLQMGTNGTCSNGENIVQVLMNTKKSGDSRNIYDLLKETEDAYNKLSDERAAQSPGYNCPPGQRPYGGGCLPS